MEIPGRNRLLSADRYCEKMRKQHGNNKPVRDRITEIIQSRKTRWTSVLVEVEES